MERLYQGFYDAIASNQVLEGSFYLGIVYASREMLKGNIKSLFAAIKQRVIRRIEIRSNDHAYRSAMRWLIAHGKGKYSRKLSMDPRREVVPDMFNGGVPIYRFRRGDLLTIRKITKEKHQVNHDGSYKEEEIHIHYFFPRTYRRIKKELLKHADRKTQRHGIVTKFNDSSYWENLVDFHIKPLHTIFFKGKQELMDDIQRFLDNYYEYERLGVPYRRGYLLYGEPGNGKTSISMSVASTLDRDVYCMNLSSVKNDADLIYLFSRVPEGSVILMEDIDAIQSSKEREKEKKDKEEARKGPTLSGLLNCLDGAYSRNNCITIMTTNHPEKIDPALKRPGRCDYHVELKNPDKEVVNEYLSFVFEKDINIDYDKSYPMAKIQELTRLGEEECLSQLQS